MRLLLCSAIIAMMAFSLSSQVFDKSNLEILYSNTVYDPGRDETEITNELLMCGDKYVQVKCWGRFLADSAYATIPNEKITGQIISNMYSEYRPRTYSVLKSLEDGTLTYFDKVMLDSYKYTEPIPQFDWNILPESKDVCGYRCRKAMCNFRGREWTAWFTEDIPVSHGPWKFGGLPGVIMQTEDSTGHHKWEAITVRKGGHDISVSERSDRMTTTRKRFNKEQYDYRMTPWKVLYTSGMVKDVRDSEGNPVPAPRRKLFYNPIELD